MRAKPANAVSPVARGASRIAISLPSEVAGAVADGGRMAIVGAERRGPPREERGRASRKMELVAVTMMGALSTQPLRGCVTWFREVAMSAGIKRERRNRSAGAAMRRSMERRNAQIFEVETTDLDESIDVSADVSAPTVVASAAPLQPCVRASAPTVRHIAPGRLPGKPMGTQPPLQRRAQEWAIELAWETAPVGAIPMPGERASAAVTMVQAPRESAGERPSTDALTIMQQAPQAHAGERPSAHALTIMQQAPREHAGEGPNAHALTIAQQASSAQALTAIQQAPRAHALRFIQPAPLAMRAGEPPVQYSVERAVSAMAAPRKPLSLKRRRSGHILVLIIGMLAGFMTVLSVVVVRQQSELQANAEPAHRANEACAAYAAEVGAIALELTTAAGNVADVEKRIGERARSVVNDRGLQSVCIGATEALCAGGDATCVAAAVMELRQALVRR